MVNPSEVYQYLLNKGIPENKVLGMLASIQGESSFNPFSHNKKEDAVGFFQHRGTRKAGLEKFGPNPQDWHQQVDFALSEPEGKKYLQQEYANPAEAAAGFTKIFERPADPEWRAQERIGMLPGIIKQLNATPGAVSETSGYPLVSFPGSETRMPVSQDPSQPQGLLPAQVGMPAQAGQPEQQIGLEQLLQQLGIPQQEAPQSRMDQWMGNPLTQIGAGILTAPGNYGDWFGAVGSGVGAAIAARQESQYQRQLEQTKLMNNLKSKVAEKMLGVGGGADGEKTIAHDVQWNHFQELKAKEARGEVPPGTADLYYAGPKTETTNPSDDRYKNWESMIAEGERLQAEGKQQEADKMFEKAEGYRSFSLGEEPLKVRGEAARKVAEAKSYPDMVQKAESQIGILGARIEVGRDLERKLYKAFDLSPAGGFESLFAFIPGSDANQLRGQLASIKGANIVETLKSLKQESTTGSTGLGGTSNWELDQLALAVENLDPTMGDEALREGIKNVVTRTQRMMELATREKEEKMRFYGGLQSRSDYPTGYTFPENKSTYEQDRKRVEDKFYDREHPPTPAPMPANPTVSDSPVEGYPTTTFSWSGSKK